MPISNVSTLYQRIHKGSEGGNEFARFLNLLLTADSKDYYKNYIASSDASGDFKGVDAIQYDEGEFTEVVKAFQFKFFPANLTSNHKHEIKSSLKSAKEKFKLMEQWILITPEDWQKKDMEWFDTLKQEFEYEFSVESNGLIRFLKFKIFHWGHNEIIELALKHPHIGRNYFPELYNDYKGLLTLASISMNTNLTNWNQSEYGKNTYYQQSFEFDSYETGEPIFDIQILNNTEDMILFQSIDLVKEKEWATLKGIYEEYKLKSVGTVFLDIKREEDINSKVFEDPIMIKPKSAFRFSLQLRGFQKNTNGNWMNLHFKFNFDNNKVLISKSITLNF